MTIAERFWSKVDRSVGCWRWTGAQNSGGYGVFRVSGTGLILAHRWAYIETRGEIPTGQQLDHLCRERRCVNPDHLESVSPQINILRGVGMGARNAAKTACLRGHPLDEANTYRWARRTKRMCRQCHAMASRKRYAMRKETEVVA